MINGESCGVLWEGQKIFSLIQGKCDFLLFFPNHCRVMESVVSVGKCFLRSLRGKNMERH